MMGPDTAQALDAVSISVRAPTDTAQKVSYLAELENIEVSKVASAAKIIVNARSGTIVIGSEVIKAAAAVTGALTVTIDEAIAVSQPGPFAAGGETAVVPDTGVVVEEEEVNFFVMEGGVNLQDIVTAINKVGASPGDLISVLEALQQAGALSAQIVVI